MGGATLALVAAVVGGLVSLVSVWFTQRSARRMRELELAHTERHRQEDREQARRDRLFAERHAGYIRFSAATRAVRDVLAACLHDFRRDGALTEARRSDLAERWNAYVVQHAEAHIIVSNEVLEAVGRVNGALRRTYGLVQRLDAGPAGPDVTTEALRRRLDDLWEPLEYLRETMRGDLGLDEPALPAAVPDDSRTSGARAPDA
ncbi:hypothetical protein ACFC5H_23960 [Streptomyces rochei]|uniref:hypothetical protein n=1 Tax=Streptomyces TaxID=1883 RepID=UPI000FB1BD3B|nr:MULTISPECIES: hypothetical protein [Streptomyces]MBJ6617964.1 hypothetical protein [Streptomyces sp. DHE17-7]NUV91317.1 hypothetical protein [Streptomyces sp. KAI 90]RSS15775.1 hypothetical protein EF915_12260 [Streptomyces sp. WAC08401]GHC06170.1 hypothetical protein GCM10010308_19120 [Streptomyces vinaceusdrappus]